MPQMFSLFSKVAPLSNGMMGMPGAHGLTQLFLGVHHERSLPPFARQSFPAWFAAHTPLAKAARGSVLLFHDEFMDYNYPQTGIAVTEILEKAGYGVELFRGVCCGRPMISKGLERGASACAVKNVPLLYEAASRGTYIVGCEPSCLLTLRDEYLHLVPAGLEEKARVVASRALLIDELLMMLHERGELALEFKKREAPETILFHGHCHQKAFADASKTVALLELAGYDVDFVNAACCGMAGLYGFEKDHYEASRAACERAVLPALRARPDVPVVVMGVSCRQQIEHFSGRPVRHVVEAVRDALV
jgi:Fe-S oxidoreductase